MTDNEIIKALEHNASKCKFYEDGHDGGLFESTLDLINRQKAENERLLQQATSEAIKEFAKRLKEKCYEDFQETYEMLSPYVTDDDIDDLVKEMIEEK